MTDIDKVLLVNKYFYQKGGAEGVFLETADLLEQHGHAVTFFSMTHPRNPPSPFARYFVSEVDYDTASPLDMLRAAGRLLYSTEARRQIERLIADERPSVAHLHNIYHQISPSILHSLKKYGIPVVMTLHDYKVVCGSYLLRSDGAICEACRGGAYYHCVLKKCMKESRLKSLLTTLEMYLHHDLLRLYDCVDVFISPSRFLKDKVESMGFRGKIVYLPNFTSLDDVEPSFGHAERSIVYTGRLSTEKGLLTLVRAARGLDATLKIVGEGPLQDAIENDIQGHASNIECVGYLSGDALADEVRRAMFVVLPSECYENNPKTVIEAFALGKPAVASRIGGIPELVRDGETGWTHQPGDVEDLRRCLNRMLANEDDIRRMGCNARKLVQTTLAREPHYRNLMAVYRQAVDGCQA